MSDFRGSVEAWGNTGINLWERVYRVLKGLPHHRLATITVSVGAAILPGPFWEPYIRGAVEKLLGVKIDVPTRPEWGVALIVIGLGYHVCMTAIAAKEKSASLTRDTLLEERIRAHDPPVFNRFIAQAPEYPFKHALSNMMNDHSYTSDQSTMINGTYYFLDTIGSKFNDDIVQEKSSILEKRLDDLTDFNAQHFSPYGAILANNVMRLCLEPQWNIDRGGNPTHEESVKYNDLGRQLTQLVKATLAAYDDLLRTGHRRIL